jgi:uncharacterized membrane protein
MVFAATVQASPSMRERTLSDETVTNDKSIAQNIMMANQFYPPLPIPIPDGTDLDKLTITPQYEYLMLQPGESDTITYKVKNNGNTTVTTDVKIVPSSYSGYFDTDWIRVDPTGGDIAPDGSMEFTATVNIPKDAERGYYDVLIAFTNDTYPTEYTEFPQYVNVASLSIEVWRLPVIQVMPTYISDMVEAGKEYNYSIMLKNTGETTISIDPELVPRGPYYYYDYGCEIVLTDDDITISSPSTIGPGETVTVNVHVNMPAEARGHYWGQINLNIADPYMDESQQMVGIDLNIWQQPEEPFTKTFNVEEGPITLEISSYIWDYGPTYGTTPKKTPSFDVGFTSPSGTPLSVKPEKIEIGGSVNLGDMCVPLETDSESIYQEYGTKYTETYRLPGSNVRSREKLPGFNGEWEVSILPHNARDFEYSIQVGK